MKTSRLIIPALFVCVLALTATTAHAQKYGTFIIDDFYTEPPPAPPIGAVTKLVTDLSAGNGPEVATDGTGPPAHTAFPATVFGTPLGNNAGTGFPPDISTSPIDNIVMRNPITTLVNPAGWRRGLSADLITGDDITTRICGNCGTGESVIGIGTGVSQWIYTDNGTGSVDFGVGAGSPLYFEYSSDLDGAVVEFLFADSTGAGSIASVSTAPLPNTGGALPTNLTLQTLALPAGPNYSDITDVLIEVSGPANLDFQIDNVEVGFVPEPSAFALSLLGLLGIGFCSWRRRR